MVRGLIVILHMGLFSFLLSACGKQPLRSSRTTPQPMPPGKFSFSQMKTFFPSLIVIGLTTTGVSGQQVTIRFNPPDGLSRIRTVERSIISTTRKEDGTTVQETDIGKSVFSIKVASSPSGYRLTEVTKSISRTINGQPFENPASSVTVGRTNALVISREGELLRTEGNEDLVEALRAVFPPEKHAVLAQKLSSGGDFVMAKRNWDFFTKRFLERTLKEKDFWKEAQSNVPETTNYMLTGVHRISRSANRTYIKLVAISSLAPQEIEEVDGANLTVAEVDKFFKKSTRTIPYYRMVHWIVFDADTGLPILDERFMHHIQSAPGGRMLVWERRVETYKDN